MEVPQRGYLADVLLGYEADVERGQEEFLKHALMERRTRQHLRRETCHQLRAGGIGPRLRGWGPIPGSSGNQVWGKGVRPREVRGSPS